MREALACPICTMTDHLDSDEMHECVTCGHEWPRVAGEGSPEDGSGSAVLDANGNVLSDGDSVTVAKDLKVKGSSVTLKAGTKIKNIRLAAGDLEGEVPEEGLSGRLRRPAKKSSDQAGFM
jgi:protein PhnA